MDRRQRMAGRRSGVTVRLNDAAREMARAMDRAGVSRKDREAFLDWSISTLWTTYKEERMNQRLIVENEIRAMGLRLPNGTVKKEYRHAFMLPADKVSNVRLDGAEELGLVFTYSEEGLCTLHGRPAAQGDFSLTLRYDTVPGEPESELKIPIAFNPNPRELWRNLPTDTEIPFYKPDSDTACIEVPDEETGQRRKSMVAASQRGRSHAQEGKARDDHFALWHSDDSDWYVLAVADGAGSAIYSRKGSEVACDTVVEHCRALLSDNSEFETAIREYVADRDDTAARVEVQNHVYRIVYNAAVKAHEAIKRVAAEHEDSRLKDFATTLMFAICKKFDFGWFIASFWVGDGAICIYDEKAKSIKLLGTPDEGEFSGQTRFLTMPEIFRESDAYARRLRMGIVPDFTALFLMSDGVSDPMFETDRNLNSYARWEDFSRKLKEGFPEDEIDGVDFSADSATLQEKLLGWLDFWSPGNHDDRTIAILY